MTLGGINGTVSANVTQSSGADECEIELPEPMPYALVTGGGESAYADAEGNYSLGVTGTDNITITSDVSGYWFNVNNQQGGDSVMTVEANPTEDVPVNFTHNSENTEEFYRAEVNAYVESNIVRDFVLAINPDYPTISIVHAMLTTTILQLTSTAILEDAITQRSPSLCTTNMGII